MRGINRGLMALIVFGVLLIGTLMTISTAIASSESSETATLDVEALGYNGYFVNPVSGATVQGDVTIDFYCDYNGGALFWGAYFGIFKDGTLIVGPQWMTAAGGNHYTYVWHTDDFAEGSGYEIEVDAYGSFWSIFFGPAIYLCEDITIQRGPDTEAPVVSISYPADGAIVGGVVSVNVAATDNVGVAGKAISIDGSAYTTDLTWDTTGLPDGSTHTITAEAWDDAGNYGYSDTITVTVNNTIPPPPPGEKIAVFFWATDAGAQWVIDKYIGILQNEGYTKFFDFKDSYNPESDADSVDAYEDEYDTIFVYVFGHGNNNGQHSYTAFRPSASIVYSNEFRTWMDRWEAPRKGIFTESCHSGDWADDFAASPYIAMSTSDETHLSYAVGPLPNEGKGSKYFFEHIQDGFNAVDSWNYMQPYISSQYPKIQDFSDYVWFV